ncbi:MAG: GGDEF domain-containing protein, partial [Nitrospirae bacterium]|nr:GGDEF domain-containing protein [Nitrospirota bacterium]
TTSLGVATYPDDTTDGYESLLNKVDRALYSAKRDGRNKVAYCVKDVVSNGPVGERR